MDQHFDAERLAAFADGSLSAGERTAAEAHAADCPQCLQLLAAMARTHEGHTRSSRGVWRLPVFAPWAAPLAAAAAALALWVYVARDPRLEPVPTEQAKSSAAPAAADEVRAPAEPSAAPQLQARVESNERSDRSNLTKSVPGAAARRLQGARRVERERFDKPSASAASEQKRDPRQEAAQVTVTADKTPAPVAAPPLAAAAPPAPGPSTPPPTVPPANAAASAKPAAESVAPQESKERALDTFADSRAVMRSARSAVTIEGLTPDRRYRWRASGVGIERSTDGGATWATVPGMPGAQVLAIATPSPAVAWFVGRVGTVLLWVEGKWSRPTFPESIDLTSVRAVSGREADVTTADGRTFRTADGGRTWSLQESPPPAF